MLQKAKHLTKRLSAFLLAVLVTAGTCLSGSVPVHAADGTIQYQAGSQIKYGSYSTSRMTFNGSNTAYDLGFGGTSGIAPSTNGGRYGGFSVRCIAR